MKSAKRTLAAGLGVTLLPAIAAVAIAQTSHMEPRKGQGNQPAPIRVSMKDLHAQGGVPRGWKFLVPRGDAAEGRKVFVALECFACHEVKGEEFPGNPKTPRGAGPELTGMGGHHPSEYFVESIMNPNRVIVTGPGFTGADGLSTMPSYADTMTLKQLIDVVADLKSLTAGGMDHGGQMSGAKTSGAKPMSGDMKMK